MNKSIPFEERVPEITKELEKRRHKWTLSTLEYDDVCQIILAHIFVKYSLFTPDRGEFIHWVNRIISSQIKNLLRNNLTIYSRPCILKCPHNLGGSTCSLTPSGTQCEECPLFKKWKDKKENHYFVKQTLPLVNHLQEVNNKPIDFVDIDDAKKKIDLFLKTKLTKEEWRLYDLLYIQNVSPKDAGVKLKLKITSNNEIPGYQIQLQLKHKVIKLSKEFIKEEILY